MLHGNGLLAWLWLAQTLPGAMVSFLGPWLLIRDRLKDTLESIPLNERPAKLKELQKYNGIFYTDMQQANRQPIFSTFFFFNFQVVILLQLLKINLYSVSIRI